MNGEEIIFVVIGGGQNLHQVVLESDFAINIVASVPAVQASTLLAAANQKKVALYVEQTASFPSSVVKLIS